MFSTSYVNKWCPLHNSKSIVLLISITNDCVVKGFGYQSATPSIKQVEPLIEITCNLNSCIIISTPQCSDDMRESSELKGAGKVDTLVWLVLEPSGGTR